METLKAFGEALSYIRLAKGLTQEDFAPTSGRTYVSELERGMKSPTLEKIDGLAQCMEVHPLCLLVLLYTKKEHVSDYEELCERVTSELDGIG